MNKKSFIMLCLLGIFLSIQSVFSQDSFIEGTITFKGKQPFSALLDVNTCKTNTDKICYKAFGSDTLKYLQTTEALSFSVNNQYFESAIINFDPNIRSNAVESEQDYNPNEHSVFIQLVVNGPVSLYVYYDNNNNEYLFIKEDEDFTFLVCYDYYVIDEATGTKTLKSNASYKKQLLNLFIDKSTIASKIKDTDYALNGPTGIKQLFEMNKQEEISQKIETMDLSNIKKENKYQFAIKAGGTIEKLDYDYTDLGDEYKINLQPDLTYSLGVSAGYSFRYSVAKPSINLYCERTPFNFYHETTTRNIYNNYETTVYKFKGASYSIQAVLNYTTKSTEKSELYYFVGLGYNHIILKENNVSKYLQGASQNNNNSSIFIERNPLLVLSGGLGYYYNHIIFEARMKTTSNTKSIPGMACFDPIISATIFVGYRF